MTNIIIPTTRNRSIEIATTDAIAGFFEDSGSHTSAQLWADCVRTLIEVDRNSLAARRYVEFAIDKAEKAGGVIVYH